MGLKDRLVGAFGKKRVPPKASSVERFAGVSDVCSFSNAAIDRSNGDLTEWLTFLLSEGHILRTHPNLIFQQAANYSESRPISEGAETRLKSGAESRAWFRWLNKEQNSNRCVMTLAGAGLCAYSPNGRQILSCSPHDNSIIAWDVGTGAELFRLTGHVSRITVCKYSPDGHRIVSGSDSIDKTTRIWDAETGVELFSLKGHSREIIECDFSPDGKRLISCSEDNTARLWDALTGDQIATLAGHTYYVMKSKFSPDGTRIVTASWDNTLRIWDGDTGDPIATLSDHTDKVHDCAFSPDGQLIVSASKDGTLNVWDGRDGRIYGTLYGHRQGDACTACAFSPDGNRIVSASTDNTLRIWDTWTGKTLIELLGHTFQVDTFVYSNDGRYILSASPARELILWDANTGAALAAIPAAITFSISPDARRIATCRENELKIWELDLSQPNKIPSKLNGIHECAYSPSLNQVVTATESGELNIYSSATAKRIESLRGHPRAAFSVDWSADGDRIVSSSFDKTVRTWEVRTCEQVHVLHAHEQSVCGCRFAPDGKSIASISLDQTLEIWDSQTGQELVMIKLGHPRGGFMCSYSPDGRRIISSGASDNVLEIRNSRKGEEIARLQYDYIIRSCSYSPDGRRIICTSNQLVIWDVRSGSEILNFSVGCETPQNSQFSPDANFVLVGCDDGVRLCDCRTGEVISHFVAWTVEAIAFGPRGFIAAGDSRGAFYSLQIFGIGFGPAYVTAKYIYRFARAAYDDSPRARCPWCGAEFQVTDRVLDCIAAINRSSHLDPADSPCANLPDEAWEEKQLFQQCPACDESLRFNPFVVDRRQL